MDVHSSNDSDQRSKSLRAAWVGLLLAVAGIGIVDMPAIFWPGDPLVWRLEAQNLLRGHLAIDPASLPSNTEPGQMAVLNPRSGLWYSKYGVMNSISLLPPAAMARALDGSVDEVLIYNLWNVMLTVALAATLMRLSGRYSQRLVTRVLFVMTTLYTTFLWYYLRAQSSEIYQTLFFTWAYLVFVTALEDIQDTRAGVHPWRWNLAWLFVAALVFTRFLYIVLIPIVLSVVLFGLLRLDRDRRIAIVRRLAPHLLIPPLVITALLGWVSYVKFGSRFFSAYHQWRPEMHSPTANWPAGVWGFLGEMRFNIFLYFPLLLLALFQLRPFFRRYPLDGLLAYGVGAIFLVLIASLPFWPGEWTYGPRYILPFLPVLSLPFIMLVDRLIDARRSAASWAIAGIAALGLLYSSYLQFRVNQVNFFFYYYVREPLRPPWIEMAHADFFRQHVGVFTDEIIRHRDDPQDMPWFHELTEIWPPAEVQRYHQYLRSFIDRGNHYWWRAEAERN